MKQHKENTELYDELQELALIMGYVKTPKEFKKKTPTPKSREPRPIETKYGVIMYIVGQE